jgi:hypothetical protein
MAATTIFDLDEFRPYAARFYARKTKYIKYRCYYNGTIYSDSSFKLAHRLYAQTKALYSFLARVVDLDVALVPGLSNSWELDGDNKEILSARNQLYDWSNWSIAGDSWVEDGVILGEAMIKIVPSIDMGTIQMQRLAPENCLTIGAMAIIADNTRIGDDGVMFEYAEVITPETIRTFRNSEPWDYGFGAMYDNPIGLIPIVIVENDTDARPTFAKMLPQLDSVNELASYLNDIIGRHNEPQWAAFGVEQSDLTKSGDNVWFFPNPNSKLEAIIAAVDIDGALRFIQEIKLETKSNLPELAFDDLRAKDQIATESLKVQLIELIAKIVKMRRRYDNALVHAHQMAAIIGESYNIGDLSALLQPHRIKTDRSILPVNELDEIRLEEARLGLEMQRRLSSGEGMSTTAGMNE